LFNFIPVLLFAPFAFLGTLPLFVLRKQTVSRTLLSLLTTEPKRNVDESSRGNSSPSTSSRYSIRTILSAPEPYNSQSVPDLPRWSCRVSFRLRLVYRLHFERCETWSVLLPSRVSTIIFYYHRGVKMAKCMTGAEIDGILGK
jgi:hypothetical protein